MIQKNFELIERVSVQPTWVLDLPLQQQSVLLLAARGPDGVEKHHPCKDVQRAYRATVFLAARLGRLLEFGEHADTFMSLGSFFADLEAWNDTVCTYYDHVDSLPHHFHMHLMHGAEILGYKHPDKRFRTRWGYFYAMGCKDLNLTPETEAQMDARLSDWNREDW
jgi:hypothetical protein